MGADPTGRPTSRLLAALSMGVAFAGVTAVPAQEAGRDTPPPLPDATGVRTAVARAAAEVPALPRELGADAARASLDRALDYLVSTQNPDGSWASGAIEGLVDSGGYSPASYFDWQVGAQAIAIMALRRATHTPGMASAERTTALERGIRWFVDARMPKRGSDWDNDTVWALLYGTAMGVETVTDTRIGSELRSRLEERSKEMLQRLLANQIPSGGWAYYDQQPFSRRPTWGTSFCTALILPPLHEAGTLGWAATDEAEARAMRYLQRCRLPNGAIAYDMRVVPRSMAGESIDAVKGSLGRIQVANWALRRMGGEDEVSDETIRRGLERFFEHHRFLDIARTRPIPHEAYYANAGYFYFFGHFYCGEVIGELPEAEREGWHRKLRPHIVKAQRKDGSFFDYVADEYLVVASTGFAAMALAAGLD